MFGQPAAATPFGGQQQQQQAQPSFGGGGFGGAPAAAPAQGGGFGGFGAAPAPAATGFGAAAPGGFGAAAPAASPFGGSGGGAFGTPAPPANAAPAFGSPGVSGGFGQAQPQQQQGGQQPGAFGAPAAASPFGAPAPAAGGLFGAAPAQAPSGGMFGGAAPAAPAGSPFGGGFGAAPAATGAFGAAPAAPSFGAAAAPVASTGFGVASSGFGAAPAAPSPGLFGAPTQAPAFGASPAPASGGMFGAPAAGAPPGGAVSGTKMYPYQPTSKTDGASTMCLHSIVAMPQYESKCFEELRYEDYAAGNKGDGAAAASGFGAAASPAAPAAGFGGFGSPAAAPAASAFGAPAAPAAGAFGAPAAPAAGAFSFGSQAPAAPGAFGAPAAPAAGGLFGAPAAAPAVGGLFGSPAAAPAPGGLFGAPAAAPVAGGAFGAPAAPAAGGLFGAPSPAPAAGGLFGARAPAPAAGGLFGAPAAPAGGGLFGAPAAPPAAGALFGAPTPAPAAGGLFGAPAPAPAAGGLFGAPASGGFGAPAPAAGGLFGSPAPAPTGGGHFGAPAPAAPVGGGLFGAPAPAAPGGLYGAQAYGAPVAVGAPASVIPPTAGAVLAQQLAAVQNQRKELEKLEVWRQRSPQGSNIIPQSLPDNNAVLSTYTASSMGLSPYRASPRSSAQIRPRGFSKMPSPAANLRSLGNGGSPMLSPDAYVNSSVKRLIIKPGSLTPKPKMRLQLTAAPYNGDHETNRIGASSATSVATSSPAMIPPSIATNGEAHSLQISPEKEQTTAPSPSNTGGDKRSSLPSSSTKDRATPTHSYGYDYYKKVVASPTPVATPRAGETSGSKAESSNDFFPKLENTVYIVTPSISSMRKMSEADLAAVSDFGISRPGYGSVTWDGSVDVRGVDLDDVVCIEEKNVAVYDNMEENDRKPAVGSKLNRPAVITINNIYPSQGPNADEEAMKKMKQKVTKQTKKLGAEFISYEATGGEWKFRVSHFSRYGFDDDSDGEDEEEVVDMANVADERNFDLGERGGRSPSISRDGGYNRFSAPLTEDESMSEATEDDSLALVSDSSLAERDSEVQMLQQAEAAYAMIMDAEIDDATPTSGYVNNPVEEAQDFADEGASFCEYSDLRPVVSQEHNPPEAPKGGICSRLAERYGVEKSTSSGTDFGMRMGRSFRVAFKPNGSFLHLRPGSHTVLMQSRPVFRNDSTNTRDPSKLRTHLRHSIKNGKSDKECPAFSLPNSQEYKSGTLSSHKELYDTLDDYTRSSSQVTSNDDPEQGLLMKRAFSLLLCLYGQEKDSRNELCSLPSEERRAESFSKWLKEACANDVQQEVVRAKNNNDAHAAIFAALTGGDIAQASSIAVEHGYFQLSVILSAVLTGQGDLREQIHRWHESGAASQIPANLLRIYTLLSGNLELEENIYSGSGASGPKELLDWRRRLALRQFFDSSVTMAKSDRLPTLVQQYDLNVSSGVAPPPYPRHVKKQSEVVSQDLQCVLYRILAVKNGNFSVGDVVNPAGHSSSIHDFSDAFHLAAAVSAIGCCYPLTAFEEANLIQSYAAQLISMGLWEWAAYVFLCFFSELSPNALQWRKLQAKKVILQHFNDEDSSASDRRSFLEQKVGVPTEWFEEALADRCVSNNAYAYVKHLSAFSPERARIAFEALLLPNLLFADIGQSLKLLEVFGTEHGTLSSAVLDFYRLSEEVSRLAQAKECDRKEYIPILLGKATSVQSSLASYRSQTGLNSCGTGLPMYPGFKVVSRDSFLAEALAGISFLHLQMRALESGISIFQDSGMKFASQLAFLSNSDVLEDNTCSTNESILRGLI